MSEKRSSFTGKIGFVLAAAGSAVGLGNIWRFPYLAAEYGGGIFLLVYLILSVTFGFALMCAEIAIGRKTGKSAIGAFKSLDKRFGFIGVLASIIPMIILPYYSVIGGWVIKFLTAFATQTDLSPITCSSCNGEKLINGIDCSVCSGEGVISFFENFIAQPVEPMIWFLVFIGLTALVVLLGVEKGIEKISKFLMPVLVILTLFIAIYSITLPGALKGVEYYIKPDFSKFSVTTVLAAMGQLFYSMSLAMGIMITYGSYMKKDVNLESSVHQIEIFDTGIAFLAGLMVIPAVFAFNDGNETALGKGPGLMFITLPQVFESMEGGAFIGAIFFILVLFAALTSSISLMETVVSIVRDKFGLKRHLTCLIVLIGTILMGIPSSLGFGLWSNITFINGQTFLDFFDFISNSVLMPIVALLTCIFVGYIIKPKILIDEVESSSRFRFKKLFVVIIRYIAPVCIVLILISSVLDALGIMKI